MSPKEPNPPFYPPPPPLRLAVLPVDLDVLPLLAPEDVMAPLLPLLLPPLRVEGALRVPGLEPEVVRVPPRL